MDYYERVVEPTGTLEEWTRELTSTGCGVEHSHTTRQIPGLTRNRGKQGSTTQSNHKDPTTYRIWDISRVGWLYDNVSSSGSARAFMRNVIAGNLGVSILNDCNLDLISVDKTIPELNFNPTMSNALNASRIQARIRLGGRKTEMSTTVAETRKSFGYLTDRALDVYHTLRDIRRGRFGRRSRRAVRRYGTELPRRAKTSLRDASSRWMEYNYAIMPLIWDTSSYVSLVRKGLDADDFIISGKSGRKVTVEDLDVWFNVKVSATVESAASRVSNQLGIISPNFIWEIIPWTFVIDWAIDVSDFLESAMATTGLKFHSAYESHYVSGFTMKDKMGGSTLNRPTKGCYTSRNEYAFKFHEVHYYYRYKLSSFPLPSLPEFSNPLSTVRRGITATAIVLLKTLRP